jgi:hypothetical protein
MCMKPAKSKTDRRGEKAREVRRQPDPIRPWENTRPRGNPEADDHDVERGMERLTALVGR